MCFYFRLECTSDKQRVLTKLMSTVSRALPGFPNTAPPPVPVCVPAVIGTLAVCRQNKNQKNLLEHTRMTPCLSYPSGGAPFVERHVSW